MQDNKEDLSMFNFNIPRQDSGYYKDLRNSTPYIGGYGYYNKPAFPGGYNIFGNGFIQPPPPIYNRPPERGEVSNVINIEAKLLLSLKLKIYCVDAEDDKEIILETGKKYDLSYICETGVVNISGTLVHIDNTIPMVDTRYINTNFVQDKAYLLFDCSENNCSSIIPVHISSIRNISEHTT